MKVETVPMMTMACVVLHNLCIDEGDMWETDEDEEDVEEDGGADEDAGDGQEEANMPAKLFRDRLLERVCAADRVTP